MPISGRPGLIFALAVLGVTLALPAMAQVTVAPGTVVRKAAPKAAAATAAPAQAAPSATAEVASPRKAPRACMRLPLSDIQFGREHTIKVAREKLEEYAQKEAAKRGWKNGYTRSAETATCEDYLWLPIGGQEYKCLVTATFCQK